jgi:hypothetical protein
MKKIAFCLLFGTIGSVSFAQSIDDTKEAMSTNIMKAKTMIDKYVANPKNATKAEGQYYKALIYNSISKKDSLKNACADCKMEAFEALKKYQQMDDKEVLLKLEQYASFFDIYGNYFDLGAKAYNAADYKGAYNNFKNAEMVEEYIRSKDIETSTGFKFPSLDTSLVQNTALSAKLAKDSADAAVYYKKITDADLSAPDYLGAYEFLAQYYMNTNNTAAFHDAVEKGKKIYPKDEYWTAIEMDQLENTGTKDEIFKKYDDLFQQNPTSYTIGYNYAVELYNYIYANDDKTINADKYKEPLHDVLKKVIAIKSTGEDNLLMAKYLYNSSFDNGDSARKIKGGKPEDAKRRKELNDVAIAQLNECIPYADAAVNYFAGLPMLKPLDKANYRATLSMLENVYEAKKDQPKADEYEKKMKALL